MKNKVIESYNNLIMTQRGLSEMMAALQAASDVAGFAAVEAAHRTIVEARKHLRPVLQKYAGEVR